MLTNISCHTQLEKWIDALNTWASGEMKTFIISTYNDRLMAVVSQIFNNLKQMTKTCSFSTRDQQQEILN